MNNIWLAILYIMLLSLNGFIIFHFVLLRFFSPRNYSGQTNNVKNSFWVSIGAKDEDYRLASVKYIYSKCGACSNQKNMASKYLVQYNLALDQKQLDHPKLNRWQRIPKLLVAVIGLVIFLGALLPIAGYSIFTITAIDSASFAIYIALLIAYTWGSLLVLRIAVMLFFVLIYYLFYKKWIKVTKKIKIKDFNFWAIIKYYFQFDDAVFNFEIKIGYFVGLWFFWPIPFYMAQYIH